MPCEFIEDTETEESIEAINFEEEQVIADEEHTNYSYRDTFENDCVSIGGSKEHATVLDNLFAGVPLNGFPTLTVSTESTEETSRELIDTFAYLFDGGFIGVPYQTFKTGIVRRGLLYVPGLYIDSDNQGTRQMLNEIATRTGLVTTGAEDYGDGGWEYFGAPINPEYFDRLAEKKITLYLYVPHNYEAKEITQKSLFKFYQEAQKAGVRCEFVVPRLVRQPSGETKLPKATNSLFLLGQKELRTYQALDAVFGGTLVEEGVPLSHHRNALTEIAWELFCCNSQDFYAERHAARIAASQKLPIERSEGTPLELNHQGRFTSLTIPELPLSVVKAPHGCGKSYTTSQFTERVTSQGDAVIHILPRTSLVQQAKVSYGAVTRLEMLDKGTFQSTKALCETLFPKGERGGQIAFCIESLDPTMALGFDLIKLGKALAKEGNEGRRIHLVLDELPSILNSILRSTTIKRPALTMKTLGELLNFIKQTGGSVLALSADLTETEVALLAGLMGLKPGGNYDTSQIFCVNPKVRQPQPYKRPILLSSSKEASINRIYQAIEDKQDGAVLVMLNSLKVSASISTVNLDVAIRERYPDARTLVLDSNTIRGVNSEAAAFMNASPYEQMKLLADYDIVLATSVIEAGLNWDSSIYSDVPDKFVRQIFVLDLNGLWGATNLLQASMRVRNQQVPCEIYTPKRRVRTPDREWLGFYPSADDCFAHHSTTMENVSMLAQAADDQRVPNTNPGWAAAYARWVAAEEARMMNPRKTLEVMAHANGHEVVVSNDVLPQSTANAIRSFLREVKDRNVAYKAAVLAGVISVEGAARIAAGESTLTEERMKANRWTPAALRERMAELVELNEALGEAAMAEATTAKSKQKVRQKTDDLGFLSTDDALEFEALNCLSVYGRDALTNDEVKWKNNTIKQKVKYLLTERVSSREWFVPAVDVAEVEALSFKKKLDEREMLMVEKLKVMKTGYLNAELKAQGSSMSAEEWATFASSYVPQFLDRRFLLSVNEATLSEFNKMIVANLPDELTEGRVEKANGLMKAAKCLSSTGIGDALKRFEHIFLMNAGDTHIEFVSNAIGVDEADDALNILRIRKGLTRKDANDFLCAAFRDGYGKYPRMKLLSTANVEIEELAEQLYRHRAELSLLIPSIVKPIRKNDGRSNAFNYLSQVFSEIGLGNLRKLGTIKQSGQKLSVIALVRKPELLEPAEGLAYVLRKWDDVAKQVAERQKFLAITDF